MLTRHRLFVHLLLVGWVSLSISASALVRPAAATATPYIVQSTSTDAAAARVADAGGMVTQRLDIVNGVAALLDPLAVSRLERAPRVTLHQEARVQTAGDKPEGSGKETDTKGYLLFPSAATGAQVLHKQKISTRESECKNGQVNTKTKSKDTELQGRGVTVAVIDSGLMEMDKADTWKAASNDPGTLIAEGDGRCIVYHDFLPRAAANENAGVAAKNSADQHGHGTHVVSTIADNRKAAMAPKAIQSPVGVAPQVNLVVARALDHDGGGSYSDVISAIQWIIANKDRYNIRVLNLSLYAPIGGPYWADPMNQAVMKAWQAGIVVVVAAGNSGPEAGTITAPGNVPYVITVGALTSGRYTASGADELARYSSRGPTESAFVKPDVLVPATRTIAPMPNDSELAQLIPDARIQDKLKLSYGIGKPLKENTYFQLSGTSMGSAEVSGIVALMLQAHPEIDNNQAKQRLLATARPAVDTQTGEPVYSPWEQGAGLVHTEDAVLAPVTAERANVGMDIALDLQTFDDGRDEVHYWGNTTWDEASGDFSLIDPDTGAAAAVWGGGLRAWGGGLRAWGGGLRAWGGGLRAWGGGLRAWGGGLRAWGGGLRAWGGSMRPWMQVAGIPTAASAARPDVMTANADDAQVSDPGEGGTGAYRVALPIIIR